jgi:hypothetical protein
MALEGGCSCGAVRYQADGIPFHQTLCHCPDCRRAAGAPAVAWFSVRADGLRWTRGTPARHRSSASVERGFCSRCGTQLTYRNDGFPDEIDVTTCSLDDPEAAPPHDHTFAARRLHWLQPGDSLPRYPRTRAEGVYES